MYHTKFSERIKLPFTVFKYRHKFPIYLCFKNDYVKYGNEVTDDVIHSTQNYMKYINRATLANLHHGPLKPGRLIGLQETHMRL